MGTKDTCSVRLRREQLDLDGLEGRPDLDARAQTQPFDRAEGDLRDERRCGREPDARAVVLDRDRGDATA
jgi:hypothetical protein